MDNENIKLAHESITSIVRSAIEKGNMTPVEIAELTQNLKNVFLPEEHVSPISGREPIESQNDTNDSETSSDVPNANFDVNDYEGIEQPWISFQDLKEGRKQQKDFCKSGAEILDPQNTYNEEYIICLEDLEPKQMLTSYLKRKFDLTPEAYRKRWGLPADYPMLTKSLSETRRANGVKRKRN